MPSSSLAAFSVFVPLTFFQFRFHPLIITTISHKQISSSIAYILQYYNCEMNTSQIQIAHFIELLCRETGHSYSEVVVDTLKIVGGFHELPHICVCFHGQLAAFVTGQDPLFNIPEIFLCKEEIPYLHITILCNLHFRLTSLFLHMECRCSPHPQTNTVELVKTIGNSL